MAYFKTGALIATKEVKILIKANTRRKFKI